jgi:hypothetical protein
LSARQHSRAAKEPSSFHGAATTETARRGYAFVGIRNLGKAQFYLISIKDKGGKAYEGNKTYGQRVPADAPVKEYWSLTAYDRQLHTVIKGVPHASRASNNAEVK